MNEMENLQNISFSSFTGNKDTDRKILNELPDDKLFEVCSLNKYLFYKVCDDTFFYNRLKERYPIFFQRQVSGEPAKLQRLEQEEEQKDKGKEQKEEKWKDLYLQFTYYVAKLKEKYNYDYTGEYGGNPFHQYEILKDLKVRNIL